MTLDMEAVVEQLPKPALIYFLGKWPYLENRDELRGLTDEELRRVIWRTPDAGLHLRGELSEQPIFRDALFLRAWDKAFWDLPECTEGCLKMRFYTMVLNEENQIVAESANRRMTDVFGQERFCSKMSCVRNDIPSRTDAAIGDCGHAPLWCLSQLWEQGYAKGDLARLRFYETGFHVANFAPWIAQDPHYTCLQCQNEFAVLGLTSIFGVKRIDGTVRWVELPTRDDFYDAARYALGEKRP